ncbi:hypothetical protein DVH02_33750, partial [Streptomyces corynorhini]
MGLTELMEQGLVLVTQRLENIDSPRAQIISGRARIDLGPPPVRTELITVHYAQDPAVTTPVLTAPARPP